MDTGWLRELADKALKAQGPGSEMSQVEGHDAIATFLAEVTPQAVLALLDELEQARQHVINLSIERDKTVTEMQSKLDRTQAVVEAARAALNHPTSHAATKIREALAALEPVQQEGTGGE